MPRDKLIALRGGTAAQWASVNPVLAIGEPGTETDTGKLKIGNGTTVWNALSYIGGAVSSVAGRTGAVVLAKADVGLANIDNTADTAKPVSAAQATANTAATAAAVAASAQRLVATAVKTVAYTAAPADYVRVNISGGSVPVTLPTAPADRTRVGLKVIVVSGTPGSTSATLVCGGSDVFNLAAGSTTLTLAALFQGVIVQYDTASAIWTVQATDTPVNVALGAAKLGSNGLLGGAGGSGIDATVIASKAALDVVASNARTNVGEVAPGAGWSPPSPSFVLPYRAIGRRIAGLPDDLLNFNPQSEADVVAANGAMSWAGLPTLQQLEGQGLPKLYRAGGLTWVRLGSTNFSQMWLPADGLMAVDEWTIQMFIRPRGYDLTPLVAARWTVSPILSIGNTYQNLLITGAPTYIQAILTYYDFTTGANAAWGARVNYIVGDFPADTAGSLCVSFDQTNGLILTAGVNNKFAQNNNNSGTPVFARMMPWSGDPYSVGGVAIPTVTVPTAFDDGVDRTIPVFARYSNAANLFGADAGVAAGTLPVSPGSGYRYRPRPKVSIPGAATPTAWNRNIGGITFKPLALPGTSGKQFDALAAAGCPMVRIGSANDQASAYSPIYATMATVTALAASTAVQRATGGGGSIGGTALGIDWSHFDAPVLALYNAGVNIYAGLCFIPTALTVSSNQFGMPNSTANFALWASAIYGRYQWLGTQATGTGRMVNATFWNEPQQGSQWNDTQANLNILFVATSQRITLDQAANGNSGVGITWEDQPMVSPSAPAIWGGAAAAAGNAATPRLNIPGASVHQYTGNLTRVRQDCRAIVALYAANGYSGLPPRISETQFAPITQSSFPATSTAVGYQAGVERTADMYQAAGYYAQMVEMLAEGVDQAAFFASELNKTWLVYGSLFDGGANSANAGVGDGLADGKPLNVFHMFGMMWKHHNGLTSPQLLGLIHSTQIPSPFPNLRGVATIATNAAGKTVLTVTYGSFRHVGGQPAPKCRVDLEWVFPGGFTVASWKHWGIGESIRQTGRLPLRGADASASAAATLPMQDYIDWESVNCIQVTGA